MKVIEDLKMIHTSCAGCVFREVDEDHPRTQTGCKFGHIQEHRENGGRVVEAMNATEEFFLLDGYQCQDKRTGAWGAGINFNQQKEKIAREKKIRLKVFVRADERTELTDITATINSLSRQTQPVAHVVILLPKRTVAFNRVDLLTYLQEGMPFGWSLHSPMSRDEYPGREIDDNLRACDSTFYMVVQAGFRLPATVVEEINDALFAKGEKFIHLTARPDGQCETIQTFIHRKLGGNRPAESDEAYGESRPVNGIGDKIALIARDQEMECLVRPVTAICPSLVEG